MSKIKSGLTYIFATFALIAMQSSAMTEETTYDDLIAENQRIIQQSDSLSRLVATLRIELSSSDDKESVKSEILKLEMMLFDLHAEKSKLSNRLLTMAQDETTKHSGNTIQIESQNNSARQISSSLLLRKKLPSEDLENLIDAEQNEKECDKIFTKYITTYHRLRELQQLYDQAKNESEAIKYQKEFNELLDNADELSDELYDLWSDIYDNKNFAYSMAIELLDSNKLLYAQTELTKEVASKMSKVEFYEQSEPALNYDYQKRGLIELEILIAKELKLTGVVDSLKTVTSALEKTPAVEDLSEVFFSTRNFIIYEPIKFVTTTIYNKTNPIPNAATYKTGVIYRIQFGAYKYEQQPTIFRGAVPMSKDRALGFWTYYGGGYKTLKEAEEAVALCKRKGFNRPEIVRWKDGVRRNLYREPLPKSSSYRVQIEGASQLSDEIKAAIKSKAPNAEVTKVGDDKYVISPIESQDSVDALIDIIEESNDELGCTYSKIEK